MAFTLYSFIDQLKSIGGFDILIPFILFYAIIVGLLDKAPWEGKDNINRIVALALSLFIVAYTPFGMSTGAYLTGLFGGASIYIAGLLVLILLLGMFDIKIGDMATDILGDNGKKILFVVLLLLAAGVWYFAGPAGTAGFRMTDTMWTILILVGLLGLVMYIGKGD